MIEATDCPKVVLDKTMKFFGIFLILFLCIGCVLSLYVNRQTKSFTNPRKDEGQPQGDAYGILSDVNKVTRDKTDTVTPDKAVTETTDKTWSSNSVSSTVIEQFIQDIAGYRTQTTKSKKKMALTLYFKSATRVLKVDRTDPDTVTNCHILEDRYKMLQIHFTII